MRAHQFRAAFLLSAAIACSGPGPYYADALVPVAVRATDSLRDLVVARVSGLGLRTYEPRKAVHRLAELNVVVHATSDFLYAEREGGCGLNCKKVDALLVSFIPDSGTPGQRLKVTAFTCKRGWVASWRLAQPSETIRRAADSLASSFRR